MIDQAKASQPAKAGFDLWQPGQLEESVTKYREALEYVDPDHYALDGYHREFGAVVTTLAPTEQKRYSRSSRVHSGSVCRT